MTSDADNSADNGQPAGSASGATSAGNERRMSLVKLVAIGTVIVTLLGAGLFAWLAWLLSHQSAPWRGDTGWWDWLEHVGGSELFDAARTTATILAVVGVGGAALVAYRRQDTAERAHQVAIDGQEIATSQHTLDSQKYQLDRDRQSHEQERDLRARFASVAEQLGATNYAVRHAGAYALASLADDWHRFGNDVERQVCVHLLCAQLRVPRVGSGMGAVEILPGKNPAEDREVRKTMITLIRSHRPVDTDVADNWKSCSLDLSGADLSEFDCSDIDLRSANLDDANLTGAVLVRSDLSKATMARANLSRANFLGATLTGAHLFSVHTEQLGEDDTRRNQVVFGGAGLKGVQLTSASLPHADFVLADLQGAVIRDATLVGADFSGANLCGARLNGSTLDRTDFSRADLRETKFAHASVHQAQFEGARHNAQTIWADGVLPEDAAPIEET